MPFADEFELGPRLGAGNYAEVFRCRRRATGTLHAVKVIDKSRTTTKQQGEVLGEVAVLTGLDHPHCLRLDAAFDEGGHVFVVLELVEGGELFARITAERHFSEKVAAQIFRDILSGVAFLHARGIIHRDLKPENLLLTSTATDARVKVVDFGFAERCGPQAALKKCCGTPLYIAPEVLNAGLFRTGATYGLAADVWSLGVILYILLCGYPPFRSKTQNELFKKVVAGVLTFPAKVWDGISAGAKDLVSALIRLDPAERLTAEAALRHPWLQPAGDVADTHLADTVSSLRSFNATQTWRRGIFGVEAINRILYLRRCTQLQIRSNSAVERLLTEATEAVTEFDLAENYVGAKGLLALLEVVAQNGRIRKLVLGNNGANNTVVERLCQVVEAHPGLTAINLDRNPISHLAGRMLLYAVQRNPRVVSLSLRGTSLQPVMLSRIALQLHRNALRANAQQASELREAEGGGDPVGPPADGPGPPIGPPPTVQPGGIAVETPPAA